MGASFFRPARRVQRADGDEWRQPIVFPDGRHFDVDDIEWDSRPGANAFPDQEGYMTCCLINVIERNAQCLIEFQVNFWPSAFEPGALSINDINSQFAAARERVRERLETIKPQRGRSEYSWKLQLHYPKRRKD